MQPTRILAMGISGLGVIVLAGCASSGGFSPAAPSSSAAAPGTLYGQLLKVGGPGAAESRPVPGEVTYNGTTLIAVGLNGRYVADVAPGQYLVDGISPDFTTAPVGQFNCFSPAPVTVLPGRLTRANVYCHES